MNLNSIYIGMVFMAVALMTSASTVYAASAPAEVSQADSAYMAGDYSEAIGKYKEAILSDGYTAELLYNLGNAYFKANDVGDAVVCYERAHRLDPGNDMISNNLRYLQSRVEDANRAEARGKKVRVVADDESFFETMHRALAKDHTSNSWAILGAMSFILFVGAVTLYIFASNVAARKVGFFSSIVFVGFSLIFIYLSFASARAYESREECILIAYKTELLTDPESNSKPSSLPLTRGTKLRLVSEEIDAEGKVSWYKVRLNADYIGWVKAADIALIADE